MVSRDDYTGCGNQEPKKQAVEARRNRLRCNRPAGHTPPHRRYEEDASITAEWGKK